MLLVPAIPGAGKPVLNAEYNVPPSQFCPADNRAGIMGALYNLNLDGSTLRAVLERFARFRSVRGRPGGGWRVGIAAAP